MKDKRKGKKKNKKGKTDERMGDKADENLKEENIIPSN